jgi:hypothetical protein
MAIWASIIKGVTGPVADYFKQRTKLKYDLKLKKIDSLIRIEDAKATRAIKELDSDTAWELKQLEQQGWKDDWVLILLSIPLVLVFIPQFAPFIHMGFQVLAGTPDWYRWLIMLVFTAIYGIRIWRRKG